jgi:hypothetical protein
MLTMERLLFRLELKIGQNCGKLSQLSLVFWFAHNGDDEVDCDLIPTAALVRYVSHESN